MPIHFQAYLWAGGGAGYLERESVVLCAAPLSPRTGCSGFLTEQKVSPLVSLAAGVRVFVAQGHSVKLEVRDWSYLDSFRLASGRMNDFRVTNLVQLDLGYAFIF